MATTIKKETFKVFSIGVSNERPSGKGKNRKSARKDEESAIITLVLSYRPAAVSARSARLPLLSFRRTQNARIAG